ncbi:hypothetical protein COO60DRAFT_1643000 [Scenedesmus sp. NREL 46B-D3]|nr:hypothetical protein COO60DRAFT_1643000 [Scenedesmus sp. NREL 46B-D3]
MWGQKWAVCTTIFSPSDASSRVVERNDWSVVIVGDKSAAEFNLTGHNLIYLDVAAQQQLVHGRVSDIWRSYVAQCLLWDVGYWVVFAPPMVDQLRSPHNYLADMQAEEVLFCKSGQLAKFLKQWQVRSASLLGSHNTLFL